MIYIKIYSDDKKSIFVQREDLIFIKILNLSVPKELKVALDKEKFIINDEDGLDFVEFKDDESIIFLDKIDWIANYDDFSDLSEKSFKKTIEKIKSLKYDESIMTKDERYIKLVEKNQLFLNIYAIKKYIDNESDIILPVERQKKAKNKVRFLKFWREK